ncbi:MAG: ferritin family protein [Lentisphaeria bacterium]|nr:ferritin family protein [Lentisphaeria bacterium]
MIHYNAEELFRMAESVERDGMLFYRQAAETVDDPELVRLLSELADWEARHEARFAALRAELPESASHEPGPGDPVEEHAADYLQAFVDGKVFPGPSRTGGFEFPKLVAPDDILAYALGREKDTIVFFLTLQQQVLKYRGRDRIQAIIDEELKHVHILERKRREIAAAAGEQK